MPAPYIMKSLWNDYTHSNTVHSFNHLQEIHLVAQDSLGTDKTIIVTFSDHVFTREPEGSDVIADAFPRCTRSPYGVFCSKRYAWSLQLPTLIAALPAQRIWNLRKGDRYAHVPILNINGDVNLYSIVFSVFQNRQNIPFDFRLHVRTAYPCDVKVPETFGDVRFSFLLTLKTSGKEAPRLYNANRKVPKL